MCDFDLSQALDSSLDSDKTGCESLCFDMTQEEVYRLDEGLDLVVHQDPNTMQLATTMLLAVTRLKQPLTRCGRGLSSTALCSAIMDSLVTETIVTDTASPSSLRKIFQRLNSEEVGFLCDVSQKNVVFAFGDVKLRAVTLKGGSCERKVSFKLARYLGPSVSGVKGLVVVLSVTSSRHISCCMQDGRASLKLEECCKKKLQHISEDEDMDRFLFLKRTTGVSINQFESLKYRGWFISTSDEDENPSVEMCRVDTGSRLTCFRSFEAESNY
ncbi:interleukin-1 beta [Clinocottus analis]|uniref:interleukin-1 beta n=1 Tax=Clinocottus analis TaxID=304258 RepID=UPI0035C093E9